MLKTSDFGAFMQALWGYPPRAWQQRLVDSVVEHGNWPDGIVAPTGTGKSAVVDAHVFLTALSVTGDGPRVPRRLAICVNRRAIVDQHETRARTIADRIQSAPDGILAQVREALAQLVTAAQADGTSPLAVINLRGGVSVSREWLNDPGACAVIAVTPDMWGSRALFGGYGATPHARPRDAGLLTLDTVLVLDEAHLNRQLERTALDTAQMVHSGAAELGVPGLQVVSTTATPEQNEGSWVGVDEADIAADPGLEGVVSSPKPVEYVTTSLWPRGKVTEKYVLELANRAEQVAGAVEESPGASGTVGVVVNRVDTAIHLAKELRKRHGVEAVECWVGRLRPMDLDELKQRRPLMFAPQGDPDVKFLVATQTVEVGVDLDWAGLVTELASGAALAQRAGRVNRRGLRSSAPIVVVGPAEESLRDAPPYKAGELDAAREWVHRIAQVPEGMTGWHVASNMRPPVAALDRHLSDLMAPGTELFSDTNKHWFAEPNLAFWLRDDIEQETEPVSLVMRRGLPVDDAAAAALITNTPPVSDEMFPVPIVQAKRLLSEMLDGQVRPESHGSDEDSELLWHPRLFLWGEHAAALAGLNDVRPGSVVVIDAVPVVLEGVVQEDVVPGTRTPRCLWEPQVGDLLEGEDTVLVQGVSSPDLLEVLAEADEPNQALLEMCGVTAEVFLGPSTDDGQVIWAVVRAKAEVVEDPDLRQEYTSSSRRVPLSEHSEAVAARAKAIAQRVGLARRWADALELAGLKHDAGKADERFQREVLFGDGNILLAKSGMTRAQILRRRRASSSLPQGWRHEQVSAAVVWAEQPADADVVARLVGTSHGRGRPFFPHTDAALLPERGGTSQLYTPEVRHAARELFETGAGWHDVLTTTEEKLGVWGIAYLEALLRGADGMASKEGS